MLNSPKRTMDLKCDFLGLKILEGCKNEILIAICGSFDLWSNRFYQH